MPPGLETFLAGLPVLMILVLMLGLRWSAARAGGAGLLITLLLAWLVFGYGTDIMPELGVGAAVAGGLAEAVFIAATILWIIFPALCIHELQTRNGSVDVLRLAMGRLSDDPRITALLIAWFFVLFMEGAAGFGTSVALAAPFLVSAGFKPLEAVTISLIGHAVGVSFGAVGTPILPQIAVTQYSGLELAGAAAVYHSLLGWLMPLLIMLLVSCSLPVERRPGKQIWGWAAGAALLFLLPYYLIATRVGPELPTLGAALLGGMLFVAALLVAGRRRKKRSGSSGDRQGDALALLRAAAPYLVLIVLIMITRLIPSVQEMLLDITIGWQFTVFSGSVAILYHPGTMLLLSFVIGALWQRAGSTVLRSSLQQAARRLGPVVLALLAMLGLSRLMVHAGMIDVLAEAAASTAGESWPLFSPFVGALGTFVTGSATASNILFTDFQQTTAEHLGLSVLALVGAQCFGAAIGNIICPHNIIAANATVQMQGMEWQVLRRTMAVVLVYALLGGLLAMFVFA